MMLYLCDLFLGTVLLASKLQAATVARWILELAVGFADAAVDGLLLWCGGRQSWALELGWDW